MPIRPENRRRYPANWREIVELVRQRSGDRCEGSPAFPDCRVPNHAIGYRDGPRFVQICMRDDLPSLDVEAADLADGFKVIEIVLTTGHLDHVPENCDLANLRHWCQRCHLHYDREHHLQTAWTTRRAGRAIGELF